ncbi:zinc-binding alcohol dehydrogenase [Sphaeroforma arctica JP610]|uniref:Zinc-binding alcohol dehydrogenase n=1 Tax=Sphaeroforma arctica JP610 TaxID=667725 RepID=A0A0L0GC67_9EUKA|nr:zinc-binding alcohol dehydrogenase [Sphaeroforma arctica JP610]KNC86509.1 zinc-binding alcohol dehydrogenase [Sphaeroforma arctica JP610]|eukprot:XP_014160411.1 zinc-binding alcohol dehydrogenase [Sphaeroforma arctica JP610]
MLSASKMLTRSTAAGGSLRSATAAVCIASQRWASNMQCRLAARPIGLPKDSDWKFTEEPIPEAKTDGDVVVKTLALSIDPAMRGWMNDARSYLPPVQIDEVMRAGGVGKVVSSKNPKFTVGSHVSGSWGVQEYAYMPKEIQSTIGLTNIDMKLGNVSQWLNPLGMPGMTAYFGLLDVCGPVKAGETIVVSAASGAVGQTVGQVAKARGLRVVGIAGGAEKCAFAVNELGFDACIDYKSGPKAVSKGLSEHCPKGVDIFFDNVGGEILDTVMTRLRRNARIAICGAISQYNNTTAVEGPANYLSLLVNRAKMQGFIVFDYAPRYMEGIQEISQLIKEGKFISKEHVESGGVKAFPAVLNKLFAGENFGKLVLKIADE